MKDFKYLAAYSIPLVAVFGLYFKGPWAFLTPLYAFMIIPVMEVIFPTDEKNLPSEKIQKQREKRIFDWMLFLNIPIVYGLLGYSLYEVSTLSLPVLEVIGMSLSLGIVLAVNGINVGHELGHRLGTYQRFFGKLLLLPTYYMHFFIEHNYGHHLHVATPEDPATAKINQSVYSFWFTSSVRQYFNAWKIQLHLLRQNQRSFWSLKNDMLWYAVIQTAFLAVVFVVFGLNALLFALISGILGIFLLETVNYIEHYGLLRAKLDSGRYERVKACHSWNSNHIIGRIVLYELTRHSDHHYKASKKYQILDCHEESPQLPYGYPTSMVLALIPPLWFGIMNKRIPKEMILDR